MATETTLDIGVVGLGGMGRVHANAVDDLGHDVVAGADVVPETHDAFAEEYDARTYEDFAEMYDQEPLDGVIITTPNKFHEPAATGAFERDVSVLCEKPLAHELDAAESMAAAEADSEGVGMVGFQSRFEPATELFKAHDERGRFGDIRHVEAEMVRRRGIPGLGSWFTNEDLSGGGALIDIGVHSLDVVLHLLEFPTVTEVTATTRSDFGTRDDYVDPDGWGGHWDTSEGGFDVEDSASAFIRCAGGTTISFEVAWAANRNADDRITVWGTEAGAALTDDEGLRILETDDAGLDQYADTELRTSGSEDGQYRKVAHFLEAVAEGTTPRATFEEGLAVQRVMDAIYESSERGRAVRLDE